MLPNLDGIKDVYFYAGTTLVGTVLFSPYTVTWNSVPAGTYQLVAVARDLYFNSNTSAPVTIIVGASSTVPTITFNGASKVYGDAAFPMTASSNSAGAFTTQLLQGLLLRASMLLQDK